MTDARLLIFGAHPDDAEIGMGGTIAKHTEQGDRVILVDLTEAELSSNGTVISRQREAQNAARLLGVGERMNLKYPDRGLYPDADKIRAIARLIRLYRPAVICTPYQVDRHPDHGACTQLVREAVFNAKINKYDVGEPLPAHEVKELYLYFINGWEDPSVVVDISSHFAAKAEALKAYASQFTSSTNTVATPLNQGYIEMVSARDRLLGQKSGCLYAEGFIRTSPMKVELLGRNGD
jgi:bacillithiol biosynthesis deacetylase BshB1